MGEILLGVLCLAITTILVCVAALAVKGTITLLRQDWNW